MTMSNTMRVLIAAGMLVTVASLAVVSLGAASGADPGRAFAAPGGLVWMINGHALTLLQQAAGPELTEQYFDNPRTYVMAAESGIGALPPRSMPAATFTSYAEMKSVLDAGRLDPRYTAVLYDDEKWQFTPVDEQRHPGKYYALAGALARRHGLIFIATPATNLAAVGGGGAGGGRFEAFLDRHIAAEAARDADVYEIQSQGAETNLPLFESFVSRAAAQAREANPHVTVLAGLSTNPTGHQVDGAQLFQAILATHTVVGGYWLNIPGQSPYCPSCGAPRPGVAADLLRRLRAYAQ